MLGHDWFRRGRVAPGKPAAALLYHAYQQKQRLRGARMQAFGATATAVGAQPSSASTTGYGGWVSLGPSPLPSNSTGSIGDQDYGFVSGRATSVVADPGDPTGNTVYVGGAYGGVWKSTNAAAADPATVVWTPVIDNQATLAVGAIAVQPSSSGPSNVILVGTGEANFSIDSYYGLGILRSADGGATWTLITQASNTPASFTGFAFSKMAFSTDNPNLVVAASTGASNAEGIFQSGYTGLYYSTDAGQSWSGVTSMGTDYSATSVIYDSAAHRFLAVVQFNGYYASRDGINWTRLATQPGSGLQNCPTGYNGMPFCLLFRGDLVQTPGREEIYTWWVNIDQSGNIGDGGLYKSTNGGATWTRMNESGITNCGDGPGNGCGIEQGWYNLALAAVPDGAGTDLYAATINIYKCTVTGTNPLCGTKPFINLTHAYGCSPIGSLAHVHPDQHGIGFVQVSPSQAAMYFANDGGIYRALNGYALTSGTCGTHPNPFQSLNENIGPMTEFVSFSQDASEEGTLLGGTQDNGSPATAGSGWVTVNGGDGGFSAIPGSGNWFTTHTDVDVELCSAGINCLSQLFTQVVDNGTVGGDHGAFYTPFIFDPQNPDAMLVGTCRVWRGSSNGSGFAALSYNFNSGGSLACSGGETQLVRNLAAGGPVTGSGSSVIYAATEGGLYLDAYGNLQTDPGRLWITNNADAGTYSWADLSPGNLNPAPISSVAVDATDPTGNTAYTTIMGFDQGHVFKTNDQGNTWTDISGNLPNAPANVVLLDPDDNNTVYVGTDVGVFTARTPINSAYSWTEVGQLPNAAVTQLSMFESGGAKQLRASTYGRGIWGYDIPFQMKLASSRVAVFSGQTATLNGTITAYNGYASPVTISCASVIFGTSTCSPITLTPSPSGTSFSVDLPTTSSTAATNIMNIQAVGSDPGATTETISAELDIKDYGLSAPLPAALAVNQGSTSPAATFSLYGSVSEVVNLSCTNLPAGASCNFYPSSTVTIDPIQGTGAISLTVSAAATTPVGTSTITLAADSVGEAAPKTASLSLTVGSAPDYTIALSSGNLALVVGGTASVAVTFTPINGYTGDANISCSFTNAAYLPCSLTPSTPVSLAGGPVTAVESLSVAPGLSYSLPNGGQGALQVNFSSSGSGTGAHVAYASLTIQDFSVAVRGHQETLVAGQNAQYEVFVHPLNGSFPSLISLTCSNLPTYSTCSFSPNTVTLNGGDVMAVLTVATKGPSKSASLRAPRPAAPLHAGWVSLSALGLVFAGLLPPCERRKHIMIGVLLLALVLGLLLMQPACGGGGSSAAPPPPSSPPPPPPSPSTPSGSYYITVTATSGSVQHTANAVLNVQ